MSEWLVPGRFSRWNGSLDAPGVIERVKPAVMGPRIVWRMQALLGRRVGVDLTNERKSTVQVGVPRDRANSSNSGRGQRCTRIKHRLQSNVRRGRLVFWRQTLRTFADDDAELDEANRTG